MILDSNNKNKRVHDVDYSANGNEYSESTTNISERVCAYAKRWTYLNLYFSTINFHEFLHVFTMSPRFYLTGPKYVIFITLTYKIFLL
jgi:hypothetical protein